MTDTDLAWAVEAACFNAWPSPRQLILGDFVLRAAGGRSRRINSVSPLRDADPARIIDEAERLYAALGRPAVFRVPGIAARMEAPLAAGGFVASGETCTLLTRLDTGLAAEATIAATAEPTAAWLALRARLDGHDPEAGRVLRAVIGSILLPRIFVGVPTDDGLASIAFGVVHRTLLVVEAVATAPEMRGRGFARRAVAELMRWGSGQGATAACLQVVADNHPARRLYDRLGFRTDLYRYVYWSRPSG